jgi:hypothetical protein
MIINFAILTAIFPALLHWTPRYRTLEYWYDTEIAPNLEADGLQSGLDAFELEELREKIILAAL